MALVKDNLPTGQGQMKGTETWGAQCLLYGSVQGAGKW